LPNLQQGAGCYGSAEVFVAAHDDFQQTLGGSVRKFAHAEVIDDE
jgi:hypothetical protein